MDKGLQCARCSEMFRAWLFRMCNMFRNASLLRMCQMYNVCLQSKSLLNLLPNTAKVLNSDFWQKASGARGSAPRNAPARRTLLVLCNRRSCKRGDPHNARFQLSEASTRSSWEHRQLHACTGLIRSPAWHDRRPHRCDRGRPPQSQHQPQGPSPRPTSRSAAVVLVLPNNRARPRVGKTLVIGEGSRWPRDAH